MNEETKEKLAYHLDKLWCLTTEKKSIERKIKQEIESLLLTLETEVEKEG